MAVKSSSFDRISQLPEDLLLQILSLLKTKNVIAMSVVSKLWRSLSKKVPNLKFICSNTTDLETFSDYFCRILLSHQAPVLQSLNLNIECDKGSRLDIGILIGIAFGLHVRKFVLDVITVDDSNFIFPRSMYNSETLETLKLKGCILVDVPFPVCLKSLKNLHLQRVEYKDEESFVNLLSGCSRLENLEVYDWNTKKVKRIRTVAVPSLQRLTLLDDRGAEPTVYVINSPPLKYLSIKGVLYSGPILNVNTPELVQARFNISGIIYLGSFTSVKRLSLKLNSPQQVIYPTGSIFSQLVYLMLYSYEPNWWNLLTLMLNGSPNLQVLEIIDKHESDSVANQKWNQPKNVPECLLLHLETLVWKDYKVIAGNEKEVAKYILRNASHLKKATFTILGINSEKRLEMLEELESVVRASNSCQLVFK